MCKFFAEIDTDENRKIDWNEFTQNVIDSVMNNEIETNQKGELPNQKEMLELAHTNEAIRFSQSEFADELVHEGLIQKVTYFKSINRMLLLETSIHIVKFVSPKFKKKQIVDLFNRKDDMCESTEEDINSNALKINTRTFILAATYDEDHKIVKVLPILAWMCMQ